MSLSDFYRPFYAELDEKSLEKVGEFTSALLQAKTFGNYQAVDELLKLATDIISEDPEALDTFLGVLSYSGKYGTPTEKIAADKLTEKVTEFSKEAAVKKKRSKPGWLTPERGLGIAAVTLGAVPLITSLVNKIRSSDKIKRSLRQILADHPELREDPNIARYFQAIVDFSPKIAENPLVAGNVLKQIHQIGPSALTPSLMKELQSVAKEEAGIGEIEGRPFSGLASTLSANTGKFEKAKKRR